MSHNDLINGSPVREQTRLTVASAQFASSQDVEANIARIGILVRDAADAGASLVTLPESSIYEWSAGPEAISKVARFQSGVFAEAMSDLAQRHSIHLVYGSYEMGEAEKRPYNRLTALSPSGVALARYDKIHLYDAFSYRESDYIAPGPIHGDFSELATFSLHGWRVGLLNCYDLRFPELTLGLIERGVDVIAMSSAWAQGPGKAFQLATLTAARAIETTSYLLLSNQAGPASTGHSTVLDPAGATLATVDAPEGLAIARLEQSVLQQVRKAHPVACNQRYRLTGVER
ncbi:nitrilase-related carbon-nitrogen hydrolase [Herbiconiux sp. YIM B11900]|uniref:nitrilase-related carbon-nitrogen hydrolase n=1 Tax=Herbiconiux sp. YIM B11900 TaxID=3404131 RepID=UPI003F831064